MLIQDPQSMCLDNVDNIYRKVEPFIRYLVSLHRSVWWPVGSSYIDSSFDIGIFVKDNENYYKKLATVEASGEFYTGRFNFYDPECLEIGPYTSYTKPFKIHRDANAAYAMLDEEEQSDSSDEEEQIINDSKTYKSDECIVCLTNPPKVLFCNCGHLCLCEECDDAKNLKTCPICKTKSTIKQII